MPVIPLVEEFSNAGGVEFKHSGPIATNAGVIWFDMEIFKVVVVPHCPGSGVNVYVFVPTVAVLITAGFHVPVMPFVELNSNAGGVEFWHSGPIVTNVGVILSVTAIFNCTVVPHCPGSGVNVYTVVPTVVVLIVAGFQVPVMLFADAGGKVGGAVFRHNGPIAVNVGVI